ncbi:serine hydrolase domain-containing protein [Haloferula chungangensis]|uniref:serine hydrolase domain-containing protein n=1 Tax=Haloferula chungangensis TaxID=1048331 RepID=UPI0036D3D404
MAFLFSSIFAVADPTDRLRAELENAHKASGAPGMAAATFDTKTILAQTQLGVRRADKKGDVEAGDLWHIGSDGKAITATLIARLVESGKLTWNTSLKEIFHDSVGNLHPQAQQITIQQLLSHTAGLPANPPDDLINEAHEAGDRNIRKQRMKIAMDALTKAPLSTPGTTFLYSNTGYIIAGAVIEELLGTTWEKAIAKEVFSPLGIKSAGFGAPSGSQPRGHQLSDDGSRQAVEVGYAGDNPAIYGPAGGMHLSLADWVVFLQDQMLGHQGKGRLLEKESYRKLHQPILNNYAMGWLAGKGGKVLQHDGSNTYWYATVTLHLDTGRGSVAVANDAGPKTGAAMHRAMARALQE